MHQFRLSLTCDGSTYLRAVATPIVAAEMQPTVRPMMPTHLRNGLAIAAALVLAACFGGGSSEEAAPPASTNVELEPGEVTVNWPGLGPSAIQDGVTDQVMAALGQYVDAGVVPALRTGKVAPAKLDGAFDAKAITELSAATSPGRAALFDEGLPKAIGKLDISAPGVPIAALNNTEGTTLFVTTQLRLTTTGRNDDGKFKITRVGELLFAPDESGTWKVTGWHVLTTREGKGIPGGTSTSEDAGTTDDTGAGGPTETTVTTTAPETP